MGTASDPGPPSFSSVIARVQNAPWFRELVDFWTKINNDWIFNLIVSLVPLLIVAVGSVGLFLGNQSDLALAKLIASIESFLPDIEGVHALIKAIVVNLQNSAGILLAIGLVTSFFAGTRLFIVLENCFSIIFRLP